MARSDNDDDVEDYESENEIIEGNEKGITFQKQIAASLKTTKSSRLEAYSAKLTRIIQKSATTSQSFHSLYSKRVSLSYLHNRQIKIYQPSRSTWISPHLRQ